MQNKIDNLKNLYGSCSSMWFESYVMNVIQSLFNSKGEQSVLIALDAHINESSNSFQAKQAFKEIKEYLTK